MPSTWLPFSNFQTQMAHTCTHTHHQTHAHSFTYIQTHTTKMTSTDSHKHTHTHTHTELLTATAVNQLICLSMMDISFVSQRALLTHGLCTTVKFTSTPDSDAGSSKDGQHLQEGEANCAKTDKEKWFQGKEPMCFVKPGRDSHPWGLSPPSRCH